MADERRAGETRLALAGRVVAQVRSAVRRREMEGCPTPLRVTSWARSVSR